MSENDFQIQNPIRSLTDLAIWIDRMKCRERDRMRLLTVQWLENIAAFHGYHDLRASQNLQIYRRLSRREENELNDIGMNYVMPHVRTMIAKAVISRPITKAVAASTDEDDIQAARYADQFLEGEWLQQGMDIAKIEVAGYLGACGNAFGHQFFDAKQGLPVFEGVQEGRISTQIVNPLKIAVEPHRTRVELARWAIICSYNPMDEIEEQYEKEYQERTGKRLRVEGVARSGSAVSSKGTDLWISSYLNMVGAVEHKDSGLDESDYCETDLLYHLPTRRYPQGLYAVKVGSEIVSIGSYPYPYLKRLPLLHWKEIMSPWRMYGEGSVNEVLKNQEMYTRLRRVERDYHLQNTCKKVAVNKKSRVSREKLASAETEVIEYLGDRPPTVLAPVPLPSGIYDSLKLTMDEGQRIGFSDSTMGNNPAGVTSGKAFLALQSMDDSKLVGMSQLSEAEYAKWGQNSLLMGRECYPEKRKYAIAGKTGAGSVWFFDRARLGDTTDVVCVPGSALPKNKLAEKEQVRADFQAGIYGNPQDPESQVRVRKMLAIGDSEDMQDDEVVHQQVCEKENLSMGNMARSIIKSAENQGIVLTPEYLQAGVMPIQDFDHDQIHLRGHIRCLNSAGVVDDPQVYWVLAQHAQAHMIRIQQRQMAMMPQEEVVPGENEKKTTSVARALPNGGDNIP